MCTLRVPEHITNVGSIQLENVHECHTCRILFQDPTTESLGLLRRYSALLLPNGILPTESPLPIDTTSILLLALRRLLSAFLQRTSLLCPSASHRLLPAPPWSSALPACRLVPCTNALHPSTSSSTTTVGSETCPNAARSRAGIGPGRETTPPTQRCSAQLRWPQRARDDE